MAALSGSVVVVMLILGFLRIGTPATQRALRADRKRVQDLYQLSDKIHTSGPPMGDYPGTSTRCGMPLSPTLLVASRTSIGLRK
jgi:hypothetical protein